MNVNEEKNKKDDSPKAGVEGGACTCTESLREGQSQRPTASAHVTSEPDLQASVPRSTPARLRGSDTAPPLGARAATPPSPSFPLWSPLHSLQD